MPLMLLLVQCSTGLSVARFCKNLCTKEMGLLHTNQNVHEIHSGTNRMQRMEDSRNQINLIELSTKEYYMHKNPILCMHAVFYICIKFL